MFDVSGLIVIVTGSNRGNGYAIAKGLSDARAKVIRADLSFSTSLKTDDRVFDLSIQSNNHYLIEDVFNKYGRIDALVNNAGISISSDEPYSDVETYEKTLAINLTAAFVSCATVCPIMAKQKKGTIVNITSLGAELGFPNNPSYQISKAGLRQLTKSIARDWGECGIRANNICPGYIRTAMTEKSYSDTALNEQRLSKTLLKRWGRSTDLVGPTIFLISDASSYITGSDIYVDGGWISNGGI